MSILLDKNTRVIVTGITGREGKYHTRNMLNAGTNLVGGVTPGKGGQSVEGLPVFDTVAQAIAATGANAACIFVPPAGAADSIMECARAGIKLIVCITENIPVIDMTRAILEVREQGAILIGPNCPGMCTPGLGTTALGMKSIYWTVDPRDWDSATYGTGSSMVNHIVSVVQANARPGAIILSHDRAHPDTYTAYKILIPWLLSQKYNLVAL